MIALRARYLLLLAVESTIWPIAVSLLARHEGWDNARRGWTMLLAVALSWLHIWINATRAEHRAALMKADSVGHAKFAIETCAILLILVSMRILYRITR